VFVCSSSGLGSIVSRTSDPITAWTFYSYNYTATTTSPTLQFGIMTEGARFYYLDDVSVVDISAPSVEMLLNPSFENSTTNLVDWVLSCDSNCNQGGGGGGQVVSNANCYLSTGTCYRDNCSGGSGPINFLRQSFSATIGHIYKISYWMSGQGGSPNPQNQFYVDMN
jgi:hypothetical protein